MATQPLDTSLHKRHHEENMKDPEYREAYLHAKAEITQIDTVIRWLDTRRIDLGISKAELARRIDRNESSIRRLFTSKQPRPELPLIAAIAEALDAELKVVPKNNQSNKQPPLDRLAA